MPLKKIKFNKSMSWIESRITSRRSFTTTEFDITTDLITAGFWLKPAVIGPTDTNIWVFIVGSYHYRF